MSDKNDFKPQNEDIESSPIRNLFRKNEADENNPKSNSEPEAKTDTEQENGESKSSFFGSVKSKFHEMAKGIKEQDESFNFDDDEAAGEESYDIFSGKSSDENNMNNKKSVPAEQKNKEAEKERLSESPEGQRSVFGNIKGRIKEMVVSIRTSDYEEDTDEIKDIFSENESFINMSKTDEDDAPQNKVIYSAPKKPDAGESEKKSIAEIKEEKADGPALNEKLPQAPDSEDKKDINTAEGNDDKPQNEKNKGVIAEKDNNKISETEKNIEAEINQSEKTPEMSAPVSEKAPDDKAAPVSAVSMQKGSAADSAHEISPDEGIKSKKSEAGKNKSVTNTVPNKKAKPNDKPKEKGFAAKNPVSAAVSGNPLPPIPPKSKMPDFDVFEGKSKANGNRSDSPKNEGKVQKIDNQAKSDSVSEKIESEKNPDKPQNEEIRVIPWQPKKKEEQAPRKNGQEALPSDDEDKKTVIYHYEKASSSFTVMAGKFTKTVRTEYSEALNYKRLSEIKSNAKQQTAEERVYNKAKQNKQNSAPLPAHPEAKQRTERAKNNINNISDFQKINNSIPSGNSSAPSNISGNDVSGSARESKFNNLVNEVAASNTVNIKSAAENNEKDKKISSRLDDRIKKEKKKQSRSKKKNKNKRASGIRRLFSSEEEYDPDDVLFEAAEEKPMLDDYNEEKDADEIRSEINENFRTVFIRTVILTFTTVASLVLAITAQCVPSLFNETVRNGWLVYAIISFVLFAVSITASRIPIVNGLIRLRHFKGNSDTAIGVASLAALIQLTVSLFTPDTFVDGTLYIYAPLVILALLLNSIGRLLIILRVYDNFRFLTKSNSPQFAGKIYTDIKNGEKMTMGLPSRKPIIAYMKRSEFMSDFLKLSYAPDPSEEAASRIAPFAALVSLILGIAYGILTLDFAGAASSFALSACITTPVCCLLAVNIPLRRLCKTSVRSGAMVTGYETVKQFSDTNTIMLDVNQLYPKGTITLSGMKAFNESKLNDAIMAGAAVMFTVKGTLSYVFESIIQGNRNKLPNVDSVVYEDGMGLVSWVKGQRVLIGNRKLLEAHNIKAPSEELEEKYRRLGNEIMYISMSGDLTAMFILSYNPSKEIMHELRNVEDNGVSFIVRTLDPNITEAHIAEKFMLYKRCIRVLPTGLGNICNEVLSSSDSGSRAYLATRGRISSFARAISGCINIKLNVTLSVIIQYIGIIVGAILVTLISFISGFQKLGCFELILYIGFWIAATVIIPFLKRIV